MSTIKQKTTSLFSAALLATSLSFAQSALATENVQASNFETEKVTVQTDSYQFENKFPHQFNTWKATSESDEVASALDEDPRLVVLWDGYLFSHDYNHPRGHFYALKDVRSILRTGAPHGPDEGPMPMACWTCKGPDVGRMISKWGEDGYFSGKWAKGGPEIVNTIGCADCHDTASKDFAEGKPALRIVRPHVLRALDEIGKPFDKSDKTDKRAAICANCHVEYYFAGKTKAVTFPWGDGMTVDDMEKYYDNLEFKDWTHKLSKAPMLKAQHPDFEIWSMGVHGKNGVTCIDCHMPKMEAADGTVYTDHQVGNPFDNFANTCARCHDQSKEKLEQIVDSRKKELTSLTLRLEDQLVHAHFEAKAAWDAGATDAQMKAALQDIRHAQWRWDYAAASHGAYVHAPDVAMKVIGTGLDRVAEARVKLARILTELKVKQPVAIPDISTREKAQAALGIPYDKEKAAKADFLKTVVPQWEKQAEENGLLIKH